jgi:hypothetical protein
MEFGVLEAAENEFGLNGPRGGWAPAKKRPRAAVIHRNGFSAEGGRSSSYVLCDGCHVSP